MSAVTLAPDGALTIATLGTFLKKASLFSKGQSVTLDLSRAAPCDSAAVALIVTLQNRAKACGATLHLVGSSDVLQRLAEIYGLESFIAQLSATQA